MNDETEKKEFEMHSLSNLLGLSVEEISYLNQLTGEQISILKNQFLLGMQNGQREIFVTIAKVSRFMPNFLNAKVSQDILGPQITANLSYFLTPKEAIAIAGYFPTKFFADVIEFLVPEKVSEMIGLTPFDQMKKAVEELISRKNFFIIGSLMDFTPIESVDKMARGLSNPEHLIHITYHCQNKKRVLELFQAYGERRIFEVISTGLTDALFPVMKVIYEHADPSLIAFTQKTILENEPSLLSKFEELLR